MHRLWIGAWVGFLLGMPVCRPGHSAGKTGGGNSRAEDARGEVPR